MNEKQTFDAGLNNGQIGIDNSNQQPINQFEENGASQQNETPIEGINASQQSINMAQVDGVNNQPGMVQIGINNMQPNIDMVQGGISTAQQNVTQVSQNVTPNVVIPKSLQGGAQTEPVPIIVDPYIQAKMDKEMEQIGQKDKGRFPIVAILLVVIVLVGAGVFMFINKSSNMTSNKPSVIDDDKTNKIEENQNDENKKDEPTSSEDVITEDEKAAIVEGDFTSELTKISEAFNNLKLIRSNDLNFNYNVKSYVEENKIIIESSLQEEVKKYEAVLNNNILTMKIPITEANQVNEKMYFTLLAESKAVVDGFDEYDAMIHFNNNLAKAMTLKENGYKVYDDGSYWYGKLDLSKKISYIDVNDEVINIDDLKKNEEFLVNGGILTGTAGYLSYSITYYPDSNQPSTIRIFEQYNFNDISHKSLLSIIEFLLGADEAKRFNEQYPEIKESSFGKYVIKLNPENENYKDFYDNNCVALEVVIN